MAAAAPISLKEALAVSAKGGNGAKERATRRAAGGRRALSAVPPFAGAR
jgi:hypothetical protein